MCLSGFGSAGVLCGRRREMQYLMFERHSAITQKTAGHAIRTSCRTSPFCLVELRARNMELKRPTSLVIAHGFLTESVSVFLASGWRFCGDGRAMHGLRRSAVVSVTRSKPMLHLATGLSAIKRKRVYIVCGPERGNRREGRERERQREATCAVCTHSDYSYGSNYRIPL